MKLLLIFFCLLMISILLIFFSNVKIEIMNLIVDTTKKEKLEDCVIIIKFKLFNKFKWLQIKIDKNKLQKLKKYNSLPQKLIAKLANNSNNIDKKIAKAMLKNAIKVEKFQLNLQIGLDDALITSIVIALIASIISIFIPNLIEKPISQKNYDYKIEPIFVNDNVLKICLRFILSIKISKVVKYAKKQYMKNADGLYGQPDTA